MFGIFRQFDFAAAVEQIEERVGPTSETAGLTECNKCTLCCWRRPGAFKDIEEVTAAAALMDMTAQNFFKEYCVVDELASGLCVMPRRVEQDDVKGTFLQADRTFDISTPCVFLNEKTGNCGIHDSKPDSCRTFECWVPDSGSMPVWSEADVKTLGWNGNKYEWDDEDDDDGDDY